RIEVLAFHALGHERNDISSTSATTACGRRGCTALNARSSPSWSQPSTFPVDQPSIAKRDVRPPGQPSDDERLSTTTQTRRSRPVRPAYAIASWLLPSSSSASPTRQKNRA